MADSSSGVCEQFWSQKQWDDPSLTLVCVKKLNYSQWKKWYLYNYLKIYFQYLCSMEDLMLGYARNFLKKNDPFRLSMHQKIRLFTIKKMIPNKDLLSNMFPIFMYYGILKCWICKRTRLRLPNDF